MSDEKIKTVNKQDPLEEDFLCQGANADPREFPIPEKALEFIFGATEIAFKNAGEVKNCSRWDRMTDEHRADFRSEVAAIASSIRTKTALSHDARHYCGIYETNVPWLKILFRHSIIKTYLWTVKNAH